jgi:hypothetical protein
VDVLVDTSAWSLAYRRTASPPHPHAVELGHLIREGRAVMIGPVRQEIFSGITDAAQFNLLRRALRAFPELLINTSAMKRSRYFSIVAVRAESGGPTSIS